jgi:hypothetical protein
LGAIFGVLAVSLTFGWLLIKRLRRQRRRDRRHSPARVVLIRDRDRTRMVPTGTAPAAPIIQLRLLTAAPLSTLHVAG